MKVIVDTCIWSQSLRRIKPKSSRIIIELTELIKDGRVQMIGPIRQELLSGIKSTKQFALLKRKLSAFPDLPIQAKDYETAADFFNVCRKHGVRGSNTDFLICAVASNSNMEIFTTDKDFLRYKKYLPLQLYEIH